MAKNWTPGPWEAHFGNDYVAVKPIDHAARIADVVETICGFTREEAEANARLIAAAPELYEALDKLLECQEQSLRGGCMPADFGLAREGARAALAKARCEP